jgi:hypothetical protein
MSGRVRHQQEHAAQRYLHPVAESVDGQAFTELADGQAFSGIRQPGWFRVYCFVFGAVWCGYLVAVSIVGLVHGAPAALLGLVVAVLGGWFISRFYRTSVEVSADELLVRNRWHTRRISRRDIEGFEVGSSARNLLAQAINVLVRGDDTVSLDVTAHTTFRNRSRRQRERQLEDLRRWAESHSR